MCVSINTIWNLSYYLSLYNSTILYSVILLVLCLYFLNTSKTPSKIKRQQATKWKMSSSGGRALILKARQLYFPYPKFQSFTFFTFLRFPKHFWQPNEPNISLRQSLFKKVILSFPTIVIKPAEVSKWFVYFEWK